MPRHPISFEVEIAILIIRQLGLWHKCVVEFQSLGYRFGNIGSPMPVFQKNSISPAFVLEFPFHLTDTGPHYGSRRIVLILAVTNTSEIAPSGIAIFHCIIRKNDCAYLIARAVGIGHKNVDIALDLMAVRTIGYIKLIAPSVGSIVKKRDRVESVYDNIVPTLLSLKVTRIITGNSDCDFSIVGVFLADCCRVRACPDRHSPHQHREEKKHSPIP